MSDFFSHPSACIDLPCEIGKDSKIWHFSHIMSGASLGEACNLGQNVFIASGVKIGHRVKIQNNVSVYQGTVIEDEVFLGPSCVLTNISNPRSQIKRQTLYETTLIKRGATIGANATIVCGVKIGAYAFIAAGSVITKDVPDYALMMGVPAQQKGWMSRHGHPLKQTDSEDIMHCPESAYRYQVNPQGQLQCLDLDESSPLPEHLSQGSLDYQTMKEKQKK